MRKTGWEGEGEREGEGGREGGKEGGGGGGGRGRGRGREREKIVKREEKVNHLKCTTSKQTLSHLSELTVVSGHLLASAV